MKIRLGYEIKYYHPQPTPMLLMLNIHYSRASDILVPDYLITIPSIPVTQYRDSFGNWCSRTVAPAGETTFTTDALISDPGTVDAYAPDAMQHLVNDLPDECMQFLLGSRYCETQRLMDVAWANFNHTPLGWGRVQAICDFTHNHITFGYQYARGSRTAFEAYQEEVGRLPGLRPPRCHPVPLHEHPGPLLHRLTSATSASTETPPQWTSAPGSKPISAATGTPSTPATTAPASAAS